jgi:hypothetical protein
LIAVADRLAARGCSGAVLCVRARAHVANELIVRAAWEALVSLLPADAVAVRSAWSQCDAVLEGTPEALVGTGQALIHSLGHGECAAMAWSVALVAMAPDTVEQAFRCDPGYDLDAVPGTVLAWVEPYRGEDWREPQRYPHVRILASAPTRW